MFVSILTSEFWYTMAVIDVDGELLATVFTGLLFPVSYGQLPLWNLDWTAVLVPGRPG